MKKIDSYIMLSSWIRLSPLLLIIGVTTGFQLYSETWYHDPFLVLIYAIFIVGQVIAVFQYPKLFKRYSKISRLFDQLTSFKGNKDLNTLQSNLQTNVDDTPEKQMVLDWISMGLKGDSESSSAILDYTTDAQEIANNNSIGAHSLFNRLTLKMGFLGTLIGLVRTFPPMKKAILGLSEKDGQSQFIKDIASAIDGDEYAILTTLVATGLSIVIESLVIFILEKLYGGLEEVHGHLYNWYIMELKPIIVKEYSNESKQLLLMEKYASTEMILAKTQKVVLESFEKFSSLSENISHRLSTIETIQSNVDIRIKHLIDHENRYIDFINMKDEASVPVELRYRKEF